MKVFITGISSFLGAQLARRLEDAGHEVHGTARQAQAGTRIQAYTLGAPVPPRLFSGCSVLIHCAWDIKNPELTDNVEATRLLAEAAREQSVPRQIFISSLSARQDAPTRYGADKYLAEKLFQSPGPDLILRPGLIVGDGGLFRQTFDFLRDHRFIPLIDGGHFAMPLVGIQELTLCIEKVLASAGTNSRPLCLFHRRLQSQDEFLRELAKQRNWRRSFVYLPSVLLIPALATCELFKLKLPITRANVLAALKNRFSPEDSDLNSLLGFEADYAALLHSISKLH